jgi:hypothetical protein
MDPWLNSYRAGFLLLGKRISGIPRAALASSDTSVSNSMADRNKENEGVVKATNAKSGYNPAFYDPEPNGNNAWRMYRCVCLFLLCQLQHV